MRSRGVLLLCIGLFFGTVSFAKTEADYVREHCKGEIEHRLYDGTRVDCLTDEYAKEYDFCHKWAESAGQALYYADITGKKPGIVLICDPDEQRFYYRAKIACPQCEVDVIGR